MKKIFSSLLILLSFQYYSFSQNQHLVDSLETQLKNNIFDTTAANILYELSKAYWGNNSDKAMDYANQCLNISEKIDYKKGIGNAFNSMGSINDDKGNYSQSLELYKKSLQIRQEIGDKKNIAWSFNNIGEIFRKQGNYPEALKNHFAALKIREEIGDQQGIAASYINLGIIYKNQSNFSEALKNYLASLHIYEKIGNRQGIARSYNNIGIIYQKQNNYTEALKNHFTALKIKQQIEDRQGIASSYNNIGAIYRDEGNYTEALKNSFAALRIQEDIGDKNGKTSTYFNIGTTYAKLNKFDSAYQYLNNSLLLSKETGSIEFIKSSYESLAELDSSKGDFKQALKHFKLATVYRDSLVNNENTKKTVQQQMQYEFDKKESLSQIQNEKELQKQKLFRNAFIVGTILFLLLAGAIYMGLRKTGKAKRKSEKLLLNILPAEVADEIKITGTAKAKSFTMVTVMFTDFKDFTSISEKISAELLVDEIHSCFSAFDLILQKYRIEKIKTIGDAYLCASGLPVSNYTHATDMINAAFEIRDYMLKRKEYKEEKGEIPFELRIGIHTGPVVAGIVGVNKYAYDIWGDTVNLAARMEQNSEAGKVNISGNTYELVKNKFKCNHRGKIEAKNKGEIDMYFVEAIA